MREYQISQKYRYTTKTVTKGTQEKYFKDGYYYKVNNVGNEGLVEYLTYRLLTNSTLNPKEYVKYEYCKINNKLGCRSYNFLGPDEEFITVNTLFNRATGYDNLADKLSMISTAEERLEYILDLVSFFGINRNQFKHYINTLVLVDLLIYNTDRHVHNYGVIYNTKTNRYRMAPIFDNGRALGTDGDMNPCSCTLCGSFEQQVMAFGHTLKTPFKLDYTEIYRDLNRIEKTYGTSREINNLRVNLEKYRGIFEKWLQYKK